MLLSGMKSEINGNYDCSISDSMIKYRMHLEVRMFRLRLKVKTIKYKSVLISLLLQSILTGAYD